MSTCVAPPAYGRTCLERVGERDGRRGRQGDGMRLETARGALQDKDAVRLPVVAIDGPAGAGKSTIARQVAERAGLLYIDTGAMYRAVTYAVLQHGCRTAPDLDAAAVAEVARSVDIRLISSPTGPRVLLDGRDVSEEIRRPEVERLVARVAALAPVRLALVPQQRRLARDGGVVLDGRDVGTAVLPDADYKFFVTAAFPVRVDRRYRQMRRRGAAVDRAAVARDLRERDAMDSARSVGPLAAAPDAVCLDTTHLRVEDAVSIVLARCGLAERGDAIGVHGQGSGGGTEVP
jgi:cytidylate kinase